MKKTTLKTTDKITIVYANGGDWLGVYINDSLVLEDSRIHPLDLLDELGIEYTEIELDDNVTEENDLDTLPQSLKELEGLM